MDINESFEMPQKLMMILADKKSREELFDKFLEKKKDLSYDWFTDYYQEEQGDRNALKQDFTPDCICEIVNKVNEKADKIADICSGTGGLTIKLWNENRDAFFHCEEVAARAVPVLLFNLAIRNIRGEVIHGDVLTRNDNDNGFGTSKGKKRKRGNGKYEKILFIKVFCMKGQ